MVWVSLVKLLDRFAVREQVAFSNRFDFQHGRRSILSLSRISACIAGTDGPISLAMGNVYPRQSSNHSPLHRAGYARRTS